MERSMEQAAHKRRPIWMLITGFAAAVLLGFAGFGRIRQARPAPPEVRAPTPKHIRAEGHLVSEPGWRVEVGSDVPGRLTFVVEPQAAVNKGDLVAELDTREQRAALAEARARAAEAEAQVRFATRELARSRQLADQGTLAPAALDGAQYGADLAATRRDAALAAVQRLEAVVAKARIVAPISGIVIARHAAPGEQVPTGARLLTVADPSHSWIEAEIDEFDALEVALGDEATLTVDALPGRGWRGRVSEIPYDVVPSQLRPQDPGRPSDTDVLLVKIALLEPTPLKLGQRVGVEVMKAPLAAPLAHAGAGRE